PSIRSGGSSRLSAVNGKTCRGETHAARIGDEETALGGVTRHVAPFHLDEYRVIPERRKPASLRQARRRCCGSPRRPRQRREESNERGKAKPGHGPTLTPALRSVTSAEHWGK